MAGLGALRLGVRSLHCGLAIRAGSKWRLQQGLPASPSDYGPLTELPDWSYADGRPAPMMKRQCNRLKKREMFARRVILLSQEMDAGMEAWKQQQEKKSEEKKQKQESRLKPKGRVGQVPLPSQ
ncbi:39S ribosomal protein L52, mitochondrial isoform X3 [Ornithorhynchus anatinus]|uniref:39S ribosomal protein L52, mitochondrial isoform X3 n=1 Tax=Ornithorhynchus anatinus TaxID=9258 RepID=UPI0010A89DC3|nr:39S ribosomal protein L52, mitochondrial isoform X3 [Ornithorhynchus anatinus]